MEDFGLGNMRKAISEENKLKEKKNKQAEEDKSDFDEWADDWMNEAIEEDDLDHWLDEEDIGNDPMLLRRYQDQNRTDNLDHGFGGRDDDGFRGLDSDDIFGEPIASGFDFDEFD